MNTTKYRDGS